MHDTNMASQTASCKCVVLVLLNLCSVVSLEYSLGDGVIKDPEVIFHSHDSSNDGHPGRLTSRTGRASSRQVPMLHVLCEVSSGRSSSLLSAS